MNKKAEYAVKILKQYAKENQTMVRSTMDISPLEEWLILRLLNKDIAIDYLITRIKLLTLKGYDPLSKQILDKIKSIENE